MENTKAQIYFDNAATTKVDEEAAKLCYEVMTSLYGNPSSVHAKGFEASNILQKARKQITEALGYEKGEGQVIFTSCATEASNTAIFSAYKLYSRNKDNIVISDSEHPSVENCAKALEKRGVKVHRIPTKGGRLDLDFAKSVIDSKTFLVSCMLVNNETGAVYDLKALKRIKDSNAPEALFHIDGVQGFLKLGRALSVYDADFVSISGHKLHAPKGVGALFVKKGVRIDAHMIGGGQEGKLRSGTENLSGIAAFGLAAQKLSRENDKYTDKLCLLNKTLRQALSELCPFALVNSRDEGFAPHIVSISVTGIRSEIMLRFLSDRGIYVSAGSACSSAHADNRVLTAFGLEDSRADSTLRVSFSHYNTKEDIYELCKALSDGERTLVKTLK